MHAKPIIDIVITITNFEEARINIQPIDQPGYDYRGEYGIPRRQNFVKGDPAIYHIHMYEITSSEWRDHLLFRDYLVQHP